MNREQSGFIATLNTRLIRSNPIERTPWKIFPQ